MKVSKVVLATVLALAVIMVGSYVFAQDTPKPKMRCEQRFIELDADKDGKVTLKEFMAINHPGGSAEEVFKMRDKNGDGALTKEEFCSEKPMKGQGKNKS